MTICIQIVIGYSNKAPLISLGKFSSQYTVSQAESWLRESIIA